MNDRPARLLPATVVLLLAGCFSDPGTGPEVILMEGSLRQVTDGPGEYGYPDWSEDGTRILLADNSPGPGKTRILSVPSAGGGPDTLYEERNAGISLIDPRWLPEAEDGAFVFLARDEVQESYGIYLARSGESPVEVYRTDLMTRNLDVTPDGRYFLFASGPSYLQQIIRLDPAAGEATALKTDVGSILLASLSCDRTDDMVSVTLWDRDAGTYNLFRLPLSGGPATRITDYGSGEFSVGDAELSPDGGRYLVRTSQSTGDVLNRKIYYDFYLIPAAGGQMQQLVDFPNPYSLNEPVPRWPRNPTWSPDGRSIAFDFARRDDLGRNIYVIEL